jgi:NTE family protein
MQLGIALSGGGMRAVAFHFGVLKRLADEDRLESVTQISTVSGGSLAIAALLAQARWCWPTSVHYRTEIYPALMRLLTGRDLLSAKAIGWRGFLEYNVRLISHRAQVLSDLLTTQWNIDARLSDLPDQPAWLINAACLETGKNWRFAKREMGNWQFGRHYGPQVSVAEAVAASAAVPYVIGALTLRLPPDGWYRTDPATREPMERRVPPLSAVRLWDGGAYENLGLEALFKPRTGLIGCDFLICSDASGPFRASNPLGILKGHLVPPLLFNLCSDQIRSLRSRMLIGAIADGTVRGVLLRMGNSVRDIDIKAGRSRERSRYDRVQQDQHVSMALEHPTDLKALSESAFDSISRHGYELTDATLTAHAPELFQHSLSW